MTQKQRKLRFGAKVEVRSVEAGLKGSWHPGIVTACSKGCREVKYDHILLDDESGNLVDAVCVSPLLDGLDSVSDAWSNDRGSIRPQPPMIEVGMWDLPYGLCVDVYHQEAWWEGVVFDYEDGSEKRSVFFPDLGDELITGIDTIRITQDWNAVAENWRHRGTWIFLELIEEYVTKRDLAVSVKQVWYDVRLKEGFQKVREWTSPMRYLWEELVLEVIDGNFSNTIDDIYQVLEVSGFLSGEFQVEFDSAECVLDGSIIPKSYTADSLAIIPAGNPLHSNLLVDQVLSGVPSNLDENSSAKSDISSDGNSVSKSKGRKKTNWIPVELHKKYCPDAVDKYVNLGKGRLGEVKTALTKHLLFLGWKVDYMIDKVRNRNQFRYFSPEGEPEYSLISVCRNLRKSSKDSKFPTSQDAHQGCDSSPGQPLVTEKPHDIQHPYYCSQQAVFPLSNSKLQPKVFIYKPEYFPQAVVSYLDSPTRGPRNMIVKAVRFKAKKHLSAVGWEFYYSETRSSKSLRFKSPKGNVYNSLLDACKVCMAEENSEKRPAKCRYVIEEDEDHLTTIKMFSAANRKRKRKRNLSYSQSRLLYNCLKDQCANPPKLKRRKASASSSVFRNGSGVSQPSRVLRSRKRVQQVVTPTSTHQNPRTILSWLIDNNVVLPREKVHYCRGKGGPSLVEGKISKEGIKCCCCQEVFTFSSFESHAGFNDTHARCSDHRPASNIFLNDGRSLLDCQMQIMHARRKRTCRTEPCHRMKGNQIRRKNDYICTVCHYGGDLILCDKCPSAFHKGCLGLEDIPDGEWYCPSCCCRICGLEKHKEDSQDTETIMNSDILTCGQCEHKYHTGCLRKRGVDMSESNSEDSWFCSKNCKKISLGLNKLLGKQFPVGVGNLTWSLQKSMNTAPDNDAITETFSRLSIALEVMHECFEPVKEPLTRRDLAEDVIFSRGSNLNRLNFQRFYTVLLEGNDELITVATVRIHGEKVAEVPLVATRFQYRRQGMCCVLMNLLEKMLMDLGVERLVLPAIPSVLNTWTTAFGFSRMTKSERLQFMDYTFLDFQDTIMCQKLVTDTSAAEPSMLKGTQPKISRSADSNDLDESSAASEMCQPERIEDVQTVSKELESNAGKRRSCIEKSCPELKQYKRRRTSNLATVVI